MGEDHDPAARRLVAAGVVDQPEARLALAAWRRTPAREAQRVGVFAPAALSPAIEAAGARRLSSTSDAEACDWVGALIEGETPAADAFALMAREGAAAEAEAIFADDVIVDGGRARLRPKPAFDALLLDGLDYLGGCILLRRSALRASDVEALASGARPAELLRTDPERRVGHLPFPALVVECASPPPPISRKGAFPRISVVTPNRDSPVLIRRMTDGVLRETAPAPAELIIVDNGSTDGETLALYKELESDGRVRIDMRPAPFNFSAMVNRGAKMAMGEAILLLNNDVEAIEPKWLALMAETVARPGVGIVGAKLLFPDRTIQHAGVIVGHGGVAGHDMKGMAEDAADPLGRMAVPHQRSAVTAACMLVRREVWGALGGFDEAAFPVAFNDVDFCLRARAAGWRVALDPRAVLIHHEGKSRRGFSLSGFLRHRRERGALRLRHGMVGMVDPFENPWRDHDDLEPNVRRPAGPLTMRFQTPARAV